MDPFSPSHYGQYTHESYPTDPGEPSSSTFHQSLSDAEEMVNELYNPHLGVEIAPHHHQGPPAGLHPGESWIDPNFAREIRMPSAGLHPGESWIDPDFAREIGVKRIRRSKYAPSLNFDSILKSLIERLTANGLREDCLKKVKADLKKIEHLLKQHNTGLSLCGNANDPQMGPTVDALAAHFKEKYNFRYALKKLQEFRKQ